MISNVNRSNIWGNSLNICGNGRLVPTFMCHLAVLTSRHFKQRKLLERWRLHSFLSQRRNLIGGKTWQTSHEGMQVSRPCTHANGICAEARCLFPFRCTIFLPCGVASTASHGRRADQQVDVLKLRTDRRIKTSQVSSLPHNTVCRCAKFTTEGNGWTLQLRGCLQLSLRCCELSIGNRHTLRSMLEEAEQAFACPE